MSVVGESDGILGAKRNRIAIEYFNRTFVADTEEERGEIGAIHTGRLQKKRTNSNDVRMV